MVRTSCSQCAAHAARPACPPPCLPSKLPPAALGSRATLPLGFPMCALSPEARALLARGWLRCLLNAARRKSFRSTLCRRPRMHGSTPTSSGLSAILQTQNKYKHARNSPLCLLLILLQVEAAMRGAQCVWHNAAAVGPFHPRELYFKVNYEGTLNVIAACKANGVSKCVMSSSPSTRFDGSDVDGLTEDQMPSIPQASYLQTYVKSFSHIEKL